jgi:hypothetical protein
MVTLVHLVELHVACVGLGPRAPCNAHEGTAALCTARGTTASEARKRLADRGWFVPQYGSDARCPACVLRTIKASKP